MRGIITHKYNWDDYGYYIYLDKLSPILYDGKTLLLDENAVWQPNRPNVYNRCIYGYTNSITINLGTSFTTFSLAGWYNRTGEWQYGGITFSSLSSGVLTLENGTYYKSFERYENNNYIDISVLEGSGDIIYFNSGGTASITTTDISSVRSTEPNAPLLSESGDYIGYNSYYIFNSTDKLRLESEIDIFDNDGDFIEIGGLRDLSGDDYILENNAGDIYIRLTTSNCTIYLEGDFAVFNIASSFTDIFGNTLSTPRTNKVARVQRYTNNI